MCLFMGVSLWGEGEDILILHSYHEGFNWTDSINESLKARLLSEKESFDLHVEYMDTKRVAPEELFPKLETILKHKYENNLPDVIICSDNNAFNFLKTYRDGIFGPVPVVFSGVNDFTSDMLDGFPYVTGVTEKADHRGTIEMILQLQPEVTHIAAISDSVPTGILHEKDFSRQQEYFNGRVELVSLAQLSRSELEEELSLLPKTTAVIFLSYYEDGSGVRMSGRESVIFFSQLCDFPVYALWDWMIGWGTVGGMVISGEAQGRIAADLTIQILRGTPADSIPVVTENTTLPLFDYFPLSEISGAMDRIPYDSVIMNRPTGFYEENKLLVWFVISIFSFMVLFIITLLFDRARRRKMSEDLAEQRNILKSTLDNIPLFVYWKDVKGKTIGGNKAYYSRFCKGGTCVDGCEFSEEENSIIKGLEEETVKGAVLFREVQALDREGKQRDYIISVLPLHQDTMLDKVILIQDISARRSLENQLKQSQRMEALGRISSGIAHDFNNLLTGILGAAELLRPKDVGEEEKDSYLDMITESCDQAHGLIKGLLSYSRKRPTEFTEVDVDKLLEGTESILNRTLKKTVVIRIAILHKGLKLMGDRSMLQSALINLGVNASDAMPEGGEIDLVLEKVGCGDLPVNENFTPLKRDYLMLRFCDSGEGIPADIVDHLFDPFFTTKAPGKGTGLGLAGVYGTVKSHKGLITVNSTPGEGSCFTLYFPLI